VAEVYARVFAEEGAPFSAEAVAGALEETWLEVQNAKPGDRYGGVSGEQAFWKTFLDRVRGRLDGGTLSAGTFARLVRHFQQPDAWTVYPDVVPTLETLAARGLPLAVVSNWDSNLPRVLEMTGLRRYFCTVSVSAIEETGKPDAEIFRRTCARIPIPIAAGEALHVGDSPVDDVGGARGAGLTAVLLDRDDRHPHISDRIRSLAELPARIDAAGPAGTAPGAATRGSAARRNS
jgi:putative hydrolase of the HAD superfamily